MSITEKLINCEELTETEAQRLASELRAARTGGRMGHYVALGGMMAENWLCGCQIDPHPLDSTSAIWKATTGPVAGDFDYDNAGFTEGLVDVVSRQIRRILRRLRRAGHVRVPQILPENEREPWMEEVADVARRWIGATLETTGGRAIRDIGVQLGFDLRQLFVRRYLENTSRRVGQEQTDVWRGDIRDILIEGTDRGLSTGEMARGITERTDLIRPRAERVSRTETAFASVKGQEEGWRQSGVVAGKQFVLAPDACPLCQAVAAELGDARTDPENAKVLKLGQPMLDVGWTAVGVQFPKADGSLGPPRDIVLDYEPEPGTGLVVPPVHPHCRCSMRPILDDEV
jgi:hypothetical protein